MAWLIYYRREVRKSLPNVLGAGLLGYLFVDLEVAAGRRRLDGGESLVAW